MHPVLSEINRVRIVQTRDGAFPQIRPDVWGRWVAALKVLFAERDALLEENATLKAALERPAEVTLTLTSEIDGEPVATMKRKVRA
jgi:hypothetical protein